MTRCLKLAQLGQYYVAPNPMVGAVLVDEDGTIIGEGWHRQYGSAHAEVNCFQDAEARCAARTDYSQCTLYVSLEPCCHYGKTPPCAKLIIGKRVGRVVVGMLDPNPIVAGNGVKMLKEAGIQVCVGICEHECRRLNRRFLCLHEKHRPYIILKWAQTSDGYLDRKRSLDDCHSGPIVISHAITKQIVHRLRAENMAIMVGTRTAVLDNPRLLTTRWSGRNPIRVLLDRRHAVPETNRIFSPESETIVYRDNTEWSFVLSDLAQRNIHSVLVEGGATLLNTIIASDLWDEIHVEVGQQSLGSEEEGVPAPKIPLPDAPENVLYEHQLYEIINKNNLYI